MSDNSRFAPAAEVVERALIDDAGYQAMYQESIQDPEGFWRKQGHTIEWMTPFSTVSAVSYDKPDVSIKWYEDGTLNASVNCLDRHLALVKQHSTT